MARSQVCYWVFLSTSSAARIVVGYALKLSLAADGAGFLLDQQAIDELAALSASGEPAYIVGWFYADPDLAASPPQSHSLQCKYLCLRTGTSSRCSTPPLMRAHATCGMAPITSLRP